MLVTQQYVMLCHYPCCVSDTAIRTPYNVKGTRHISLKQNTSYKQTFFLCLAKALIRPRPFHCGCLYITYNYTNPQQDSSKWELIWLCRSLPTKYTRTQDEHPYPKRYSNPHSQQSSGPRLTPLTAGPSASPHKITPNYSYSIINSWYRN